MRPTFLLSLLSFCGCLLLGLINSLPHCGPNVFYVTWPNGTFKRCLHCSLCHPGWGLYPNCGEHITYPPTDIHCKKCVYGKTFSEAYDYSGCKSCHICAENEIVTKNCTRDSDTVCNGNCIRGYFYRSLTRDCKKCSYCCNDGKDEEQQECIDQGLKAAHRYCAPRPDKRCGPAPTSLATTTITKSSAKQLNARPKDQKQVTIALILSCVGIGILLVGFVFGGIHIQRRRIKRRNERLTNAENGAVNMPTNEDSQRMKDQYAGQKMVRVPRLEGVKQNEGFESSNSTPQGSCKATPTHTDDEFDESLVVNVKTHKRLWKRQNSKEEKKEKNVNDSKTESLFGSAQDNNALSSTSESCDGQPGRKGAEGRHERKRSRSGSIQEAIARTLSKEQAYQVLPDEDPDQPQGESCPSLTIVEHPNTQKQAEGSRVELKCIVKGGTKVTYQWFKDGEELPEEKSSSLILHPLKVQNFGFYKCDVRSCDAGQHNSPYITSNVAELDVAPSAGRGYRLLKDVFDRSINTKQRVENQLCQEVNKCKAWERVAFKYKMDLDSLKISENPGEEVIACLKTSNPSLTVYHFCKTLKEENIRRLDIVDVLSADLFV
ncbi:uncharacterized protein [Montipora capricornis]|uniref:uncharacterized protein isoform X4 n=1 Tax=Montipora capricornis TaxID=246305 RepID=UPI0035F17F58